MDSQQINASNVDSDSYSSEFHQIGKSLDSETETNNQIIRLQAEMSEIKSILATLTQQVICRPEK